MRRFLFDNIFDKGDIVFKRGGELVILNDCTEDGHEMSHKQGERVMLTSTVMNGCMLVPGSVGVMDYLKL